MAAQFKINAHDLEEYLSVLARYSQVPRDDDEKLRELIRSYAELKFRILGGSKCGMCRAAVRHVVPVISIQDHGEERRFTCLCTRCFEGEKALAQQMFLEMGESRIEVKLPNHEPAAARPPRVISIAAHTANKSHA